MLTPQYLQPFGLRRDPFYGDVTGDKDVYLTGQTMHLPLYLRSVFEVGGMAALIGEVGSGKSTLRRRVESEIGADGKAIKRIFPRTVDKQRLTASAILNAIVSDLGAKEPPKRTLEGLARQVEALLIASHKAGNTHILVIEEAHDLHISTLKYLKRIWEIEYGYHKLLGILLVGQPELKRLLDLSTNWEAREIIQRIELLELPPLASPDELRGYLELKFSRCGAQLEKIFSAGAVDAIFAKLASSDVSGNLHSSAYPLRVNNAVRAAMKNCIYLGESRVEADHVE